VDVLSVSEFCVWSYLFTKIFKKNYSFDIYFSPLTFVIVIFQCRGPRKNLFRLEKPRAHLPIMIHPFIHPSLFDDVACQGLNIGLYVFVY